MATAMEATDTGSTHMLVTPANSFSSARPRRSIYKTRLARPDWPLVTVVFGLTCTAVLEALIPSVIWPYVTIALFALFAKRCFKVHPEFSVVALPVFFTKLLLLISLLIIGHGFYIY